MVCSGGRLEYRSILGGRGSRVSDDLIRDLRLLELINDILGRNQDEFLRELYLEPLSNEETAVFRLMVFQDLMMNDVYRVVEEFVERIRESERLLQLKGEAYDQHRVGLHLDAALTYINAVESFYNELRAIGPRSEGLRQFLNYLEQVINSPYFRSMKERAREAREARDRIIVKVRFVEGGIKVSRYDGDGEDLTALIERTFSIFGDGGSEEVRWVKSTGDLTHIHAAILEGAFRFYREEYETLRRFMEDFPTVIDEGVRSFVREIEFYLTYLRYMRRVMERGYTFSIPSFTRDGSMHVKGFYNLLLVKTGKAVVSNDIDTDGTRRIFVITGMNSGGKTTFAISLGQLAYLSTLGLPVPAVEARLPFFTSIMTAFPTEEDPRESLSRLEHDVIRALNIIKRANDTTLVIANELFSTTTSDEGFQLSKLFLTELNKRRSYCLFITFIPKVATLDFVISLVAMPSPEDPEKPSYRIVPGPPPREYMAVRIAAKHQLLYDDLRRVIR
ncbi:MAG: hypothetical protein L7G96_01965 [Vulcanisaeta sp.]|nr:hypothetical protein [Vulcanisaeta sp.]